MMGYDYGQQSKGFSDKEDDGGEEDEKSLIIRKTITLFPYNNSSESTQPQLEAATARTLRDHISLNIPLMDSSSSQARNEDMDGNCRGSSIRTTDVTACLEKEHMFDKVVTPSDVGKLNRLVIPKQHAERYFPLDSSANEKGLLLNFEDRNGKPWRFRYSYWNSSQSYVMTKGWSRFVKEKQLDAGDIVSFERGVGELGKDRLFIDWRRRPDALPSASFLHHHQLQYQPWIRWNRMYSMPSPLPSMPVLQHRDQHFQLMKLNSHPYHYHYNNGCNLLNSASSAYQMGRIQHGVAADYSMVIDSVPVVHGKSAAKKLRLFGVNMECPTSDEMERNVLSSSHVLPSHPLLASPSFPSLPLRLHSETPHQETQEELSEKGKSSLSLDLDL